MEQSCPSESVHPGMSWHTCVYVVAVDVAVTEVAVVAVVVFVDEVVLLVAVAVVDEVVQVPQVPGHNILVSTSAQFRFLHARGSTNPLHQKSIVVDDTVEVVDVVVSQVSHLPAQVVCANSRSHVIYSSLHTTGSFTPLHLASALVAVDVVLVWVTVVVVGSIKGYTV